MAEKTIDIALESTSQEILSKANTLALETTAQSILTAAQEAKTAAENTNSAVSGGLSSVKSVQRGVISAGGGGVTKTVTISAVDVGKTVVILEPYTYEKNSGSSTYTYNTGAYVSNLTSTSLTIVLGGYDDNRSYCGYQVIEYA